ncbi:CvpA family protein [Flavobacterium sp.]|uniref:CvpA family protein n=1 Tax=Flavobacterium sp. TaxID=239 RepID=UPI00263424FB|nr:CvpA family protein [Flavobacterium sp.]
MNVLDFFIGLFLVIGIVKGFRNGFFVELASLISILLGIFIAIKFSYLTKSYLEHHGSWNPKTIQVVAFAITFILVIVGVSMLAKVFTAIANFAFLGLANSILGGIVGLFRTVLVMSILLNLFQKINADNAILSKETKEKSMLFLPVQEISKTIYPSISEWFEAFKSNGFEFENDKKES